VNGLLTVSTADLADLVAPLRSVADRAVDAFALGAWSAVVEPGDAVGGLVRRILGPAVALRVVLESLDRRVAAADPSLLGSALRNEGVDPAEVDDRRIARALSRWEPRTLDTRILSSFRAATALGLRLVVPGDADWPDAFDDLGDHAPAALWLRGAAELPEVASTVAVVGCRASSAYGDQVAADLSSSLADRGFCIVSGGAYGIDGMAHRAALAAEAPTVAVMAGGVDRFYPTGHDALLRAVVERGLLVSESPCGSTPSKWRFLQRNRVIAALAAVSVVVEAGRRSGALNTAAHAQALGRPVGAVPGPVTSPSSVGCHALIRAGLGVCVTTAADVVELVPGRSLPDSAAPPHQEDPERVRLLDALSTRVDRSTDEVSVASGLSTARTRGLLAEMEHEGLVARAPSGWRRRRRGEGGRASG
jgi:DNA processing protein